MKIDDFARGSEKLTSPIEVGKVHYYQRWLKVAEILAAQDRHECF